jgi:hypothetical protein
LLQLYWSSKSAKTELRYLHTDCTHWLCSLLVSCLAASASVDSNNHQHTTAIASERHLMKRAPDALLEKYLRKANKYEAQSEQAGSFQSHIDRAEKLANNQLKLAVWQSRDPHSAKILGNMYLDKLIRAAHKIKAGQDVDGRLAHKILGWDSKRRFCRQMQREWA